MAATVPYAESCKALVTRENLLYSFVRSLTHESFGSLWPYKVSVVVQEDVSYVDQSNAEMEVETWLSFINRFNSVKKGKMYGVKKKKRGHLNTV